MNPGIHQLTMSEYLALSALSSGLCNTLLQSSPHHAKWEQENRVQDDTDASDAGTAIHDGLLEGLDRIAAIDAPDWRTKAAKEQREAARANGMIPMLAHKIERVKQAIESAHAYIGRSEIKGIFDTGKPEQTLIWTEGAALCKARPDWLTADQSILLHVKTTAGSAKPESWIRNQLGPMGYDVAIAFYERGLYAATDGKGRDAPLSVFLVIEQAPPYGCSLVSLDPAYMELAASKVERAIAEWGKCQALGKYPAYPSRIAYAEPRPWELASEEGLALGDAFDQLQGKEGLQA